MFSAISSSTTITITPVSPVSALAPAARVAVPSSSGGGTAAGNGFGSGFGAGQATQFTSSGADPGDANTAAAATVAAARPGASQAAVARVPVTLDAQLMQIENKLADCVNCPSAKTPAGQSQIDALSSQIRQIHQRMLDKGDTDAAYGIVAPPIGLNVNTCV